MGLGVLIGYLLRNRTRIFKRVEQWVSLIIYMLLFFLGLSVGKNSVIIKNFHLIGFQALVITLAAVCGSVFLCWLVYLVFFRKESDR
jgi:uncharacterized membrane protein YbjE (DUF340 family)